MSQRFLSIYSGIVTLSFAALVLLEVSSRSSRGTFDVISVHRINVVEPDGTVRLVISDKALFPGSFYMGKEYVRADREATGFLFTDEEGTESGGLIFGGGKDRNGIPHSWGHLSFDAYQRDQTMVLESMSDGDIQTTYYGLNDDATQWAITPEVSAEFQRWKAMDAGPERSATASALRSKYPGGIVNRGFFGREKDKSVSLILKDLEGHERLVARVGADGTPRLEFRDAAGKLLRTIGAEAGCAEPAIRAR